MGVWFRAVRWNWSRIDCGHQDWELEKREGVRMIPVSLPQGQVGRGQWELGHPYSCGVEPTDLPGVRLPDVFPRPSSLLFPRGADGVPSVRCLLRRPRRRPAGGRKGNLGQGPDVMGLQGKWHWGFLRVWKLHCLWLHPETPPPVLNAQTQGPVLRGSGGLLGASSLYLRSHNALTSPQDSRESLASVCTSHELAHCLLPA